MNSTYASIIRAARSQIIGLGDRAIQAGVKPRSAIATAVHVTPRILDNQDNLLKAVDLGASARVP